MKPSSISARLFSISSRYFVILPDSILQISIPTSAQELLSEHPKFLTLITLRGTTADSTLKETR